MDSLFFFFKFIYQFYTLNGFFFLFFFFRRDDPCNVAFFFIVQQFAALAAPFDLLFEKGVLLCRQKKSIILLSTHNVIRIDILLPFHTFQIPRFEFRRGCKSCYAVSSRYSRFAFVYFDLCDFACNLVPRIKKRKKKNIESVTNAFRARINLDKFRDSRFLSLSLFLD